MSSTPGRTTTATAAEVVGAAATAAALAATAAALAVTAARAVAHQLAALVSAVGQFRRQQEAMVSLRTSQCQPREPMTRVQAMQGGCSWTLMTATQAKTRLTAHGSEKEAFAQFWTAGILSGFNVTHLMLIGRFMTCSATDRF